MTDRRADIARAAVRVLARAGSRGLTHRAVDAEASLPAGSTSNLHRTRRDLVTAVVRWLLASDERLLAEASGQLADSPGAVAAAFVHARLDSAPEEVVARASLLTDPDAVDLRAARVELAGRATSMRLLPPDAPAAATRMVLCLVDGILLDAVLHGRRAAPADIAAAVDAIVTVADH